MLSISYLFILLQPLFFGTTSLKYTKYEALVSISPLCLILLRLMALLAFIASLANNITANNHNFTSDYGELSISGVFMGLCDNCSAPWQCWGCCNIISSYIIKLLAT